MTTMTDMVDVRAAAVEVQRLCVRQGWRFCFIGRVAVQRWGNPRFTVDVDLGADGVHTSADRRGDGH